MFVLLRRGLTQGLAVGLVRQRRRCGKALHSPGDARLSDGEAIVDAAIAGMGIAQLPASLVRRAIVDGTLLPILQSNSDIGVEVSAVWPKQRHLNPRVRYVVDQRVERSSRAAGLKDHAQAKLAAIWDRPTHR